MLAFSIVLSLVTAPVLDAHGALNGKALFESKCTVCHDVKVVLTLKKRRKQWNDTIADMRSNGAKVSEAEAAAIVNYLLKSAGR